LLLRFVALFQRHQFLFQGLNLWVDCCIKGGGWGQGSQTDKSSER